ncbi:MAG: beta-lactamase family protein [Brooklawnia sp.]|nr:beta-lactamase family protein [Brooklawnia sp.]
MTHRTRLSPVTRGFHSGRCWRRHALPAAVATLAIGLLAACGGQPSNPSSSTTGTPGTSSPSGAPMSPANLPVLGATVEAKMAELLVPGAVVLVRTPESEWLEAFGSRQVGADDPVTVDDHFRIGSNTKTMTGTVLLQLVDEGLISLDDPVSKYRPDVPNGDAITVEQLLTMRSGLFSYSELESFNAILDEDPERVWQPEELVVLGLAEPVYFAPGAGFHYSNTNTVLAGLIIEQLTGNKLEVELEQRLYEPLGLTDTSFPPIEDAALPAPHPHGYLYGTNVSTLQDAALPSGQQAEASAGTLLPNDVTNMNPSWGWAAGAAISTVSDLADYVEVLIGGGLLSSQLQQERLDSIQPSNPDDPSSAGYGIALAQFGPMLGHDGSLPGFQSFMAHDPERSITLIVLTNLQAGPGGEQVANEIARAVIGELYAD